MERKGNTAINSKNKPNDFDIHEDKTYSLIKIPLI